MRRGTGPALAVLALAGCDGGAQSEIVEARRAVVGDLVAWQAVAATQAFTAEAEAMAQAVEAFCASPDAAGVDAARTAWRQAKDAYKHTEILMFGPVIEQPWRFGPKLDFWPVRGDSVEAWLAGDGGTAVEDFEAMGTATRGLPVVEYMLWPEGDVLEVLGGDPRRCAFAVGAAQDVAANGGALAAAWQDPWTDRLVHPEEDATDDWIVVQDVLDEWVNRMIFTLENLRVDKLGTPKGDKAGGELQPDTLESRPSGTSLSDARAALLGVRDVFTGAFAGQDHKGIASLVPEEAQEFTDDLLAAFDEATARLDAVPDPLEDTLAIEPEVVTAAQDALRAVQTRVQVDLAQGLGVTVTFNDNDGD